MSYQSQTDRSGSSTEDLRVIRGQIQFKKKWGAQFKDSSHYVLAPVNSAAGKRIETVETNSTLMETAATLWRSGVPLPLTAVLGKPIRRYLTK